ncbi:MAG: heme-binding protein [Pelagibacterales bacterium]|nr:heme-binding protein [Pelagibacterales bacterium]
MILNYFIKFIGGIFFSLIIITSTIMANEEPDFIVLQRDDQIEVRQYKNFLTASIEVEGDRKEAINKGFRFLFKYISGENKNKESISMTIPVMQKNSGDNKWNVSFVVPKKFDLKTVPQPDNTNIQIKNNNDLKVIAITFSGLLSDSNIQENELKLRNYIKQKGMRIEEPAIYAGYNAPWIPWFLKRNEVILRLLN